MKMLISATPIFVNVLDTGTILQIVLQLEIETTSSGNNLSEDLHDTSSKFFSSEHFDGPYSGVILENNGKQRHYSKNERDIRAFHPSVPTPPPNC